VSFLLSLIFSLQQNWRTRGQNRFSLEVRGLAGWEEEESRGQGGEMAQTMYTYMNKYKNNKKEKETNKNTLGALLPNHKIYYTIK
jgi:hypothetical protein